VLTRHPAESKTVFADCTINGHLAAAEKSTHKRMPPHEQQVKDKHSESETIMIRSAFDVTKILALKLRRCVLGNANLAPKDISVRAYLKGVAINQTNQRFGRD
jgi:hypothetical protein